MKCNKFDIPSSEKAKELKKIFGRVLTAGIILENLPVRIKHNNEFYILSIDKILRAQKDGLQEYWDIGYRKEGRKGLYVIRIQNNKLADALADLAIWLSIEGH